MAYLKMLNILPKNKIIVGCNYHISWQSNTKMRFVLKEVVGSRARLITRESKRDFWTNVSDLIFIESNHNMSKALKIINKKEE